jgi:hypothetical protein
MHTCHESQRARRFIWEHLIVSGASCWAGTRPLKAHVDVESVL